MVVVVVLKKDYLSKGVLARSQETGGFHFVSRLELYLKQPLHFGAMYNSHTLPGFMTGFFL